MGTRRVPESGDPECPGSSESSHFNSGLRELAARSTPDAPKERPPSEPIPEQPDEEQVLPPCLVPPKGREVELSGACYVKIGTAPCSPREYEREGECYIPVVKKKKKRTAPVSQTKPGTTRTQDEPGLKKQ